MKKWNVGGIVVLLILFWVTPVTVTQAQATSSTCVAPSPAITHRLALGSVRSEVASLQQFLKNQGYFTYPTITSYFGPLTKAAVTSFQKANGIDPVGIVGPITRAKIAGFCQAVVSGIVSAQHNATSSVPVGFYSSGGGHSRTSTTDTTAPTVSVTAPTEETYATSTVSLSASATDNVGIVGVQFKVDGSNVGAEDTSAPYSVDWDSTEIEDGDHSVTAVARDAAGNTTISVPVTVTVDNTVPTGYFDGVSDGHWFSTVVPAFHAHAADANGIAAFHLELDGENVGTGYDYTPMLTPGAHTIAAVPKDAAGNIASILVHFIVDVVARTLKHID